VLSVAGERKQHERRKQARLRIQQGRSENPSLGLIIEGEIPPVRRAGVKEVVAISPLVERKLFTHRSPVAAQVRAVSIALNTPDIAIIQGPPGTGKTTVINAIYERLGEIASERGGRSLPTLLTGPQHDAVLNMIERMDARGLPIEKMGQKGLKGGADQDEGQVQQFERWLVNYTEKVTRQFPRFQEHHWVTRVREALDDYRRSPTDAKALRLLEEIWASPPALLSATWRMQAREASDALSRVGEPQVDELRSRAISILQSLRITHAGFADDGADAIERLLSTPEMLGQLLPEEVSQLRELSHSAPDDASLRWIRALRQKLAEVFVPTFSGPSNSPRASVILLAEKVLASAASVTRTEGPEAALARFVQQIGVDPLLLRNAAREYATAVAATVQQSQSNGVSSSVFGGADAILPRFDAVIVDEAARATPGDLMIPMTFARQRIILVGDHRQLPHMIDEQIIKQLEDEGSTEGFRDALERSLFQHLKERAEALTLSDGIQRVVTLDAQFRMHPTLGQFVSENFYLPYGESFASPRPGSDFEHTLKPFAGSCAGWVDVGRSLGAEEKVPGGTSYFRVAEVDAVEGLLRRWTEDLFSRNLSVGVIAFYSEQRDRLKERISSESLDPSGRVTVGTVDSFQGREFDAVILSAVRTSPAPGSKAEYGHLVSANRLCVAMSRQKRLLVVVGDGKHFSGESARKKVPALRSFYRICDEQSAVIG
jgi:energy-coupling factor transporter ATP-binding protein EcfA2